MDVDGPCPAGVSVPPHIGQQEIPREHPAWMLDQVLQQEEFLGSEPNLPTIDGDNMLLRIDHHLAETQ